MARQNHANLVGRTGRQRVLLAGVSLLTMLATGIARGDVQSGPDVGKDVAAAKVRVATGDDADKELDCVDQRKEKPTIYLFIDADRWDRPMARYVRTLDAAAKKAGKETQVVAIWLTSDQDKTKEYLPKAQMSLKLEATVLTQFTGAKSGPEGWGINDMASLTTIVAKDKKVQATFAYVSLNETDVPKVEEALGKALAEKKEDKK